jgi:hypothetical protein
MPVTHAMPDQLRHDGYKPHAAINGATASQAGIFWQALDRHGGDSGFRRNDNLGMFYGHSNKCMRRFLPASRLARNPDPIFKMTSICGESCERFPIQPAGVLIR